MSDATVPWEAFDITHPDHNWWVQRTGQCLASECPEHKPDLPADLAEQTATRAEEESA